MNKRLLLLFCIIWLVSPASGQPNQWITNWLIAGPFPLEKPVDPAKAWDHLNGYENNLLAKFGGESGLKVKAGNVVLIGKKSVKWTSYTAKDSIVDLRAALTRDSPVFAYAFTEIQSDKEEIRFLAVGTNDGGSLWFNGVKVWDYPSERGLKVDHDIIPVSLKKGVNTILVKVEQRGNRWEFCARFKPFTTKEFTRGDFVRIEGDQLGRAVMSSRYSDTVLGTLVKNIHLTVTNSQGKVIHESDRTNNFLGQTDLQPAFYQAFEARLDVTLKNGQVSSVNQRFFAGKRITYPLFGDGKTDYRIVLDAGASESEQWAATELQKSLKEISGIEFPVDRGIKSYNGPRIIVGFNSIVAEKNGSTMPANLDESYQYLNAGADILIFGGKQRGTMYGVMAFLENELGCRWYTPGSTIVPKRSSYDFTYLYHRDAPGVRVRNDFYFEAFDPTWAAHNKMNGSMGAPKQPGGVESYWAVHTFYPLMPPDEFFSKHPEYYSELNGKREHDHAQLCLSNPEVLKIITERIKKRMRESPEYLIYDVSQNDWYNPCQCNQCQAIVKREGSESGIVIWFVNQIADAVRSEFPDKFIGTLAYQYTRQPPLTIKPKDNVVVRFCSIECCFSHDFKSCPENKSFLSDLNKWASLAPHLYIWDYVVNFSHYVMPYPNFGVLQSNIKTFRDNNAIGIMEQAAYQSRGGEFSELRSYLISKLLWNPDADVEPVINDFIYGYYGRSGKFVREYFDLLHRQVTPETHIHLGLTPTDRIFSDDFVNQSVAIFEEAKKVADNEEMLRHVEMAYLPVLYLKCRRTPVLARSDGSYAALCKIIAREEVKFFSEAGGIEAFHNWVRNAK